MPRFIRLSILPLVGLLFVLAALLWSQRELRLRLFGASTEGRIVGMALERKGGSDLLVSLRTELVFMAANGTRFTATYLDLAPDAATEAWLREAEPNLARVVTEAASGDAMRVRWALRREARRGGGARIVRVEREDLVSAYLGLPAIPEVLTYTVEGVRLPGAADSALGVARIRAVFDASDAEVLRERKGESLVEYLHERNGVPHEPARRDFFLHAEPYATQFRPVFAYPAKAGAHFARLSHIGRHGGPTLALRLFGACRVYHDAERPEEAILTAVPGAMEGKPLDWFSRFCEGVFAQWGATALILLAGLMFIVTGAGFASLVVFPSKRNPAGQSKD